MENLVSKKVKWLRGMAFAIYIMMQMFASALDSSVQYMLPHEVLLDSSWLTSSLSSISDSLIWLVFFLPLIFIASNKATKTACTVAVEVYAIRLLCHIIIVILCLSDTVAVRLNGIPGGIIDLLSLLSVASLMSVILNNTNFDANKRKWVYIVMMPYSILMFTVFLKLMDDSLSLIPSSAIASGIGGGMLSVFCVIAFFKLIYSPAFDGNYDSAVKADYDLTNKFFLGFLIPGIICTGIAFIIN